MAEARNTGSAASVSEDLLTRVENLTKASTDFAWTMTVFGFHQGANVVKGMPSPVPPAKTTGDFQTAAGGTRVVFDGLDHVVFDTPNEIQKAMIGTGFRLLRPSSYTPKGLLDTGTYMLQQGLGIAARMIPGDLLPGASKGWGPVGGAKG